MTDLLNRIAVARGPDRELDRAIEMAWWQATWGKRAPKEHLTNAPRYTASIDAALTLMPEGHYWTMDSWVDGYSAGIWRGNSFAVYADKRRKSVTAALALLSAILSARGVK